jgi:L-ascorbate metabolism protein UlaG (beta-lactamase superfamily)
MEITWYGLSCFRLTERGTAAVVTDPFNSKVVGMDALKLKADIVTSSHDAPGHNHLDGVKGSRHQITGPGEFEIGGVFINGIRTTKKKKESSHNTVFSFDYDGVTVAHLGDLNRMLTQSEVDALGDVNVALVPVGGGNSLNAAKAAEVISMLDPGFVIPMHFKSKGVKLELDELDKFLKQMGVGEVAAVESLKVTKSSVPEETKVVVLERKS